MSDPFTATDWHEVDRSHTAMGHSERKTVREQTTELDTHPSVGSGSVLSHSTLPANAAANASSKPAKKKNKKNKGNAAADTAEDAAGLALADVELTSPSGASPSVSKLHPPSPPSALGGIPSDNHDYAISVMPSPPAASAASSSNRSRLGMHAESADDALPVQTPLPAAVAAAEHFERHLDFNDALAQSAASAADAASAVGIAAASVQTQSFPSNLVRTSKYTAFDFIPRNLFEQFNEPANLYFLCVGILQAIPAISTTAGIPTHYLPLLFIVAVSATRAAVEDYSRHQSDEQEGRKKYLVYDGLRRSFVTKSSADIVVGDVVQMVFGNQQADEPAHSPVSQSGDSYANYPASSASASAPASSGRDPAVNYSSSFPADMLFLSSSHEKGHCFVETASLDGETSLRIKQSLAVSHHLLYVPPLEEGGPSGVQTPNLRLLDLSLDIEAPNAKFDSFKGVAHINPNNHVSHVPNQKVALKPENLLLRGTELRNTPSILGLVVYTGMDSKIRRNVRGASSRSKKSALMMRVNYLLVVIACLQLSLCFFSAVLCFSWTERNYTDAWYLRFTNGAGLAAFSSFFTWFIILAQLVPISLLVSNELVKAAQAKFIAWDRHLFDDTTNQPCVVRNSQLHENLGQIEYIFSDKTGTLTQNKMEFRVGFVGSVPFGSPDSEIARRVAQRMEQLRREQQGSPQPAGAPGAAPASSSSSSGASSVSQAQMDMAIPWTTRVAKLVADQKAGKLSMPAFNDDEKSRMLTALWGPKQSASAASASSSSSSSSSVVGPADKKLAAEIRMYLTHMAISNTITPELKKTAAHRSGSGGSSGGGRKSGSPVSLVSDGDLEDEYILNFSSPDELALCQFAAGMGFQFQSRGKDGVQLCIDKQGYGDGKKEIEIYLQLATLDFTSTRKRVTCVYQRENQVFVMCKGADANVLPLIAMRTPETLQLRATLDAQLSDMATKGLRTLVVAGATLPSEWWFGSGAPGSEGMNAIYRSTNLPDRGAEKGHNRGECRSSCRICAGLLAIERSADLALLGATAIEDRLQDLVPEAIDDFLKAGIKVWMLTGDKRETAKNIALACMLIDPDMEASSDLLGSLAIEDLNRVIEITGDWLTMCNNNEQLRQLFDILDCGGDVVDGHRTGYISREELRLFLVGLRVPGMDDDRTFAAHWHLVESINGRIAFGEFSKFMRNLQPSHLKAVQTDIELGLRKARLIAGDGTEEEKRERLEKTPISLVVEGEAFSVFYPDTKVRKELAESSPEPASRVGRIFGGVVGGGSDRQRQIARRQQEEDEADFSEPEALLLRETFFELASMAKSVICCRLTPAQKGKIVQEFSKRHVTLAIGDGGNDELMIKRASVGVGIAGLEGTAASRASDIAIGSFRFLHTLLFVHGYWCSRRISRLVLFIFYKAALVAFSMYLYGFYSAWSGQQCLAPDTEIAMADGSTKRAADVRAGDLLVGKSGAVQVLSATAGAGKQLYRITDDSGYSHDCTCDHLVTVVWRYNSTFALTPRKGTQQHRLLIVTWWDRDSLRRCEQRFRVRRSNEPDLSDSIKGHTVHLTYEEARNAAAAWLLRENPDAEFRYNFSVNWEDAKLNVELSLRGVPKGHTTMTWVRPGRAWVPPVLVRDTDEEFIAYGRQWLASRLKARDAHAADQRASQSASLMDAKWIHRKVHVPLCTGASAVKFGNNNAPSELPMEAPVVHSTTHVQPPSKAPLKAGELIEIQADRLALMLPLLDGSNHSISTDPLVRLQLVPLPPRQSELLTAPDPAAGSITLQHLHGFRRTAASAVELGDGAVCHEFAQVMGRQVDGAVGYRAIREDDKIRVVYMLHNPLTEHSMLNAQQEKALTIAQIESAWKSGGVPLTGLGVLITELNPICSNTGKMRSLDARYDEVCRMSMQAALDIGTSVILAFGKLAKTRWRESAHQLAGVLSVKHTQDAFGVHEVVLTMDNRRIVRVVLTSHPSYWPDYPQCAFAIRHAHVLLGDVPPMAEDEGTRWMEKLRDDHSRKIISVGKTEGDGHVAIAVDGDHRFALASGILTHNCFNDAIYILFNVCFTALPIIMLAIFDRGGLSAASLENDPRAYLSMAHGGFFNDGMFFSWMIKAFWNSLFIFGVVYLSIGAGDTSGVDGRAHGMWLTSTVMYTIVVLLVTCRILFECESINVFVWVFVIGSFVGYFPVVYFASTLERINPNLFGVFEIMMRDPLIWALMAFAVAVPLLVDVGNRSWKNLTKPTYVTVMQERQRLSVADRLRMDQEAAALNSGAASNQRVRTRTVPHLSQQQKDGQLILKIRKALEQANHESARAAASSSAIDPASAQSDNSQKRAEALVYTMTRFQNLSGSNFDATPQRNILQLYEVQNSLTPAQLEAIRHREAEIAAETQKQHSVQLLKQQQAEKQREEERQRRSEEDQQREWQRQSAEHQRAQSAAGGKKKRSAHRASDVGSANELVLNLADAAADRADSDSDVREDSEAAAGRGQGRVHLDHQLGHDLDDEIELSTHDLGDSSAHDPEHFVFQPRTQQ